MTKAKLKKKTSRLIERRDHMNEEIEGCLREIKLLDAEESRRLLEKYEIESEVLADLIYRREQEIRERKSPMPSATPPREQGRDKDKGKESVEPAPEQVEEMTMQEAVNPYNDSSEEKAGQGRYDPLENIRRRKGAAV